MSETAGAPQAGSARAEFAPFRGINVLDLSRLLPGPWATAVLAEHGAQVVKVEDPERGDYSRWNAPFVDGASVYFEAVNRHKVGVRLDLRSEHGRDRFLTLVREADVIVESFRPGVLDRLGLGYDVLSEHNPGIVLCSLTGFGQHGPYAGAAGHDLNVAGVAGLLKFEDGRPVVPAIQMADFAAASNAVVSILSALLKRARTGRGAWLDVAMLDSLLSWVVIRHAGALARMSGSDDPRIIEAFGGNPRYNVYECSDSRWVSVSLLEKKFWSSFCELVGRPDLVDPDESDEDRLTSHGDAGPVYAAFLIDTFRERPRDTWVAELHARDIPCFPVYEPDEVWQDPHVRARGLLRQLTSDRPGDGPAAPMWGIGSPLLSLSDGPRPTWAPRYRWTGVDEALARLRARGEGSTRRDER